MPEREYGRVETVSIEPRRAALLADTPAGVTVLTVDETVDFDETGGTLLVGTQVVKYLTADDDTGTITLAAPLAAAAAADDWVHVYDTKQNRPAVEKVAAIRWDDDEGGDTLEAVVAHALFDRLEEGMRAGEDSELVALELDGDEWFVVNIEDQEPVKVAEHYLARHSSFSNYNIPSGTWTLPVLAAGVTRGFDPSTGPSADYHAIWRVTTAGVYLILARVTFEGHETGRRVVRVLINGTPVARANTRRLDTEEATVQIVTFEECVPGDILSVEAWQNSGGALGIIPGADLTSLRITRL